MGFSRKLATKTQIDITTYRTLREIDTRWVNRFGRCSVPTQQGIIEDNRKEKENNRISCLLFLYYFRKK